MSSGACVFLLVLCLVFATIKPVLGLESTVRWEVQATDSRTFLNRSFHVALVHLLTFYRRSQAERALHEITRLNTDLHVLEEELHMKQWRGFVTRDKQGALTEVVAAVMNWHLPKMTWLGPYCSDYSCYLVMVEARFRADDLSEAWHEVHSYAVHELAFHHIGELIEQMLPHEELSAFIARTHADTIWPDAKVRKVKLRLLDRDNELILHHLKHPHDSI